MLKSENVHANLTKVTGTFSSLLFPMWVKVSIAALVIALLGGAMYYLDNEEALTKERKECVSRYKNLNGLRGEFTEEKTKYVDFLVKNEALTNDINALTKQKDELEAKTNSLGGTSVQEQGHGKYPGHCGQDQGTGRRIQAAGSSQAGGAGQA